MPTSWARPLRLSRVLGYERTLEGVTAKKIARREASAAGDLKLQHLEAPFPAIYRKTPVLGLYTSDLGRPSTRVQQSGAPNLDRPFDIGMERPRPNVGSESPHLVVDLSCLAPPTDDPVLTGDLRSISSMKAILFGKGQVI